jgi:uncharacterized membrane protein YfhO
VYDTALLDTEQVLAALNANDFDPRATALLTEKIPDLYLTGMGATGATAQVVEKEPGKLVLNVPPTQAGLLVVSQTYDPGWQATVDGRPAPIYRVDHLLQGIPLEAGSRRVELTYRPSPAPALLSAVALAICLMALLFAERLARPGSRGRAHDAPSARP